MLARGANGGAHDNGAIMSETVRLRAERAELMGFPTYAHFRLDDTMAKTPEAALGLLRRVWAPAREQAMREAEALQAMIAAEGGNFELKPWDWRYYAEKRRKALYDIDESRIEALSAAGSDGRGGLRRRPSPVRPFLRRAPRRRALSRRRARLDGAGTQRRADRACSSAIISRGRSKHSGAWMTSFRDQQKLDGEVLPIILNVTEFRRAPAPANRAS